jgi:hypothetical protein
VELFVQAAVDPTASEGELVDAYPARAGAPYFIAFCEELVEALRRLLRTEAMDAGVLEAWMQIVRRAWDQHASLNSPGPMLMQQMLYRMRMAL